MNEPTHAIECRFGTGHLVVEQITRPNGDVGVIIYGNPNSSAVGTSLNNPPVKDYIPQPGGVLLIFDSPESAEVLLRNIVRAVESKFGKLSLSR